MTWKGKRIEADTRYEIPISPVERPSPPMVRTIRIWRSVQT